MPGLRYRCLSLTMRELTGLIARVTIERILVIVPERTRLNHIVG